MPVKDHQPNLMWKLNLLPTEYTRFAFTEGKS